MSFTAKYPGTCRACPDPINVDDHCLYVEDPDDPDTDIVVHEQCASTELHPTRRTEPPLCPECFTTHVGECL